MKELDELKDCTFQPKLTIKTQSQSHRRVGGNMYERQLKWLDNKEMRLEKERKKESKDEIRQCTFKPDIKQSETTYAHLIQKSIASGGKLKNKKNLSSIKNFMKRLNQVEERKKEHVEGILKKYESSKQNHKGRD